LDIVYGTYGLQSFVEFDRPEMCEGGALEWRIEQNVFKLWRTNVPEGL
jgi:hypothetical protein